MVSVCGWFVVLCAVMVHRMVNPITVKSKLGANFNRQHILYNT